MSHKLNMVNSTISDPDRTRPLVSVKMSELNFFEFLATYTEQKHIIR